MIHLKRTTSFNEDFRKLVLLLDADLWQRYPDTQSSYTLHNNIQHNNTVVVAFCEKEAVGCGCFRRYSAGTIEIKRMFVKQEQRGKKISLAILVELEAWARELGFVRSILETGTRQHEAIGLYQKAGYSATENYGPYLEMPLSRCLQKAL